MLKTKGHAVIAVGCITLFFSDEMTKFILVRRQSVLIVLENCKLIKYVDDRADSIDNKQQNKRKTMIDNKKEGNMTKLLEK